MQPHFRAILNTVWRGTGMLLADLSLNGSAWGALRKGFFTFLENNRAVRVGFGSAPCILVTLLHWIGLV